jgi:hypothetical protein
MHWRVVFSLAIPKRFFFFAQATNSRSVILVCFLEMEVVVFTLVGTMSTKCLKKPTVDRDRGLPDLAAMSSILPKSTNARAG